MASTLTEVFWVTFLTIVSGMIIKLASMCYKSKCKEVTICCIKIVRDTAEEAKEEENRVEHQISLAALGQTSQSPSPSSPIMRSNSTREDI
jgi:hypothetical protein